MVFFAIQTEGTINSLYLLDYDVAKALPRLLLYVQSWAAKSVFRRAREVGGKKLGTRNEDS